MDAKCGWGYAWGGMSQMAVFFFRKFAIISRYRYVWKQVSCQCEHFANNFKLKYNKHALSLLLHRAF